MGVTKFFKIAKWRKWSDLGQSALFWLSLAILFWLLFSPKPQEKNGYDTANFSSPARRKEDSVLFFWTRKKRPCKLKNKKKHREKLMGCQNALFWQSRTVPYALIFFLKSKFSKGSHAIIRSYNFLWSWLRFHDDHELLWSFTQSDKKMRFMILILITMLRASFRG